MIKNHFRCGEFAGNLSFSKIPAKIPKISPPYYAYFFPKKNHNATSAPPCKTLVSKVNLK
nr:MAG TPA: hypothetical protein [Caudoviricetes sp.]